MGSGGRRKRGVYEERHRRWRGGGGDYQWMTLGKILRNHDDCGGVRSLQYVVLVIVSIRCLRTHRSLGGGRGKIKYRIGGG